MAIAQIPNIVATYDYHDESGHLLHQTVRYAPKNFRQRRPDGHGGGSGILQSTRVVLYRLRELLAADPSLPVYVAEGEKDADRLTAEGLVATTSPMGAGKWRPNMRIRSATATSWSSPTTTAQARARREGRQPAAGLLPKSAYPPPRTSRERRPERLVRPGPHRRVPRGPDRQAPEPERPLRRFTFLTADSSTRGQDPEWLVEDPPVRTLAPIVGAQETYKSFLASASECRSRLDGMARTRDLPRGRGLCLCRGRLRHRPAGRGLGSALTASSLARRISWPIRRHSCSIAMSPATSTSC